MAFEFKPFHANHIRYIEVQKEQEGDTSVLMTPEQMASIQGGLALSAWDGVRCVGAAGIIHLYPHRAIAWALLSWRAERYMLRIARKVRQVLEADQTARIEMTVKSDFEAGLRFAKMIGMEQETGLLRKHGAAGEDEYMFVRIK